MLLPRLLHGAVRGRAARLGAPVSQHRGLAIVAAARRSKVVPLAITATAGCAITLRLTNSTPHLKTASSHDSMHSMTISPEEATGSRALSARPLVVRMMKLFWRIGELGFLFTPILFWYAVRNLPFAGKRWVSRERLFQRLVRVLTQCGPVGIKWGQWASTRYDLFEDDFCEALGKLTNQAPSHPFSFTKETVERAFGLPLSLLFDRFESEPIASGSIGQVHLATLRRDGSQVAVKVQHPNLPERLALDMAILRLTADIFSALFPRMRIGETANQFATNFEMQLDFRDEARFLQQFRRNYDGPFWRAICTFPRPADGLVSHDVLVETFEEGESVATFLKRHGERSVSAWRKLENGEWVMEGAQGEGWNSTDDDALRSSIALCGVQSYLKMMIWDNLIHADLHPGNVLIRMEEIGPLSRLQRYLVFGDASSRVPHIVFLDAGLAASFPDQIAKSVHSFFDAVVQTDGVRLGKSILGLAPEQPHVADKEAFIQEDKFRDLDTQVAAKCAQQKSEFVVGSGNPGKNIRSYMESVRNHGVILDPTVMVALMSMLVLEGWQSRLDPQISIMDCIEGAIGGGVFGRITRFNRWVQTMRENAFGIS